MDGEKNIMSKGKSPSDFAAIVTSPHSEEDFSRALPAQKAPHEVGGGQIVEKLLGPLWEGAPPAGGGGESFTQARRFRAKARLSPSGPSGHLPPRGRFFDTQTPRSGELAEPARPEGLFPVCHHDTAKKSAVFLQKIAPQT